MKKGCLLWLLQLAALTGLYYLAFRGRFSPPADLVGALVGGFFLLLSIGAFRNVLAVRRDRARLDGALSGGSFEDGKPIAAIGPIMALGAPIPAPFSHQPCVIYSYDISHIQKGRGSSRDSEGKDVAGFALTPCVVQTPGGNVRILGFPTLEGFAEVRMSGREELASVESYLRSTSFEKMGILKVFSVVKELLADEDGHIRKDWWMAGDDFRPDPHKHTTKEQIVRDGETVTAFGLYKAELGGIVPGLGKGGEGIKLLRGDSEAAGKLLKGKVGQSVTASILLLLFSHLILFFILFLREPSFRAGRQDDRDETLIEAAQNGDMNAVTAQLDGGAEADARDSDSNTPLMLTRDPRVARRLILAGADVNARNRAGSTPLIEAAKSGSLEITRMLLQAKVDVEARESEQHWTALQWAVAGEHEEVAKALRAAGARDDTPRDDTPRE
jgi:hypothetical protein